MLPSSGMWATTVQDVVWQRWRIIRRRIGAELKPVLVRLGGRRAELGLATALTIFFMIAAGVSPLVAVTGLLTAAAWAVLRPSDAAHRDLRAAGVGQSGPAAYRLWR